MDISLGRLPWYGQVGAFALLSAIGIGAFHMYYESPAAAEMTVRTARLAALQVDIVKGHETERQLPQFRAQLLNLQGRLENLKAVLPDEKDAADLLRRLQTVATQSNLTIRSFKPAATVTKQLHVEWPIALELDGTFHNLAIFFDRVGKFTRIVNVSALDIKGKDKPDPGSTITATCTATTFVLLDKPEPPKKAAPPAGRGI
ncbi:MAG: type 4a pilus biogenesis protein PilO [Acidobacteriota bacterium]